MYEMKPECYTGLEDIDAQHARLFELAQETHDLLDDNLLQDKTEELTHLISELIDYTKMHFAHEEAYQKSIGYPFADRHAIQHRQFEDKLMEFDFDSIGDDYNRQNEAIENLLEFLVSWLTTHILKVDMLYVNK